MSAVDLCGFLTEESLTALSLLRASKKISSPSQETPEGAELMVKHKQHFPQAPGICVCMGKVLHFKRYH